MILSIKVNVCTSTGWISITEHFKWGCRLYKKTLVRIKQDSLVNNLCRFSFLFVAYLCCCWIKRNLLVGLVYLLVDVKRLALLTQSFLFKSHLQKKSRIRERQTLSIDADSRTNTILERLRDFCHQKRRIFFF